MKKISRLLIVGLMSIILALSAFALVGCDDEDQSAQQPAWITGEGAPTVEQGSNGVMYLDSATMNLYFKEDGSWRLVGNIKGETGQTGAVGPQGPAGETGQTGAIGPQGPAGETGQTGAVGPQGPAGEAGQTPIIDINEDGYWTINGEATDHYAGDEKMSVEEFNNQLAHYGSSSQPTVKNRIRISFSVKMKAGTKFTFVGDGDTYKWSLNEQENTGNKFEPFVALDPGWNLTPNSTTGSGWKSTTEYITQKDGFYPVIVMSRIDGKDFTEEELMESHSWYTVDGVKVSPVTLNNAGSFTEKEFKSQVAHMGSVPMPTNQKRASISFSVKMEKGTKVTYLGGSNYNWAVVESSRPGRASAYLDTGWLTSEVTTYDSQLDDMYLILTLKKVPEANFSHEDIGKIHSLFKVEGEKSIEEAQAVERKEYAVKAVNHRGFCVKAPENSLEAYRLSAKYGFHYVECDVQFTSDGVPVLLHDGTIDRTSNGSGNIGSITYEQALSYDFGAWYSSEYKGTKIPTLDEFIALCVELDLHPYIEIKGTLSTTQAKTLVDIVDKYEMLDDVTWISFGIDALTNIASADTSARLGYIADATQTNLTALLALSNGTNEVFFDSNYKNINMASVSLCRNAGIALEAWTVDKVSEIINLDPYVSGVTSNWAIAGEYLAK